MGKILENYIDLLPRYQARKIEDELKRYSGTLLRTPLEFREALQEELRAFLSQDEELRLKLIPQTPNEYRDSESLNWMMRAISSDLDSLGLEADTLSSLSILEEDTMRREVLDKLRFAIEEAEAEVERMELVRGNTSGLSDAIVDYLNTDANRLPRTDEFAHYLYSDPKTAQEISPEFDAVIGNGIRLPIRRESSIIPSSVKEVFSSDVRSESERLFLAGGASPSTPGSYIYTGELTNLIDRVRNTFWVKALVTEEKLANGALSTIEISLGQTPVQVNYIQIESADFAGQYLQSVYFLTEDLFVEELQLTSELKLDGNMHLTFSSINAIKIVCVFKQYEYLENVNRLTSRIERVYRFGIDNILIGSANYLAKGYYISKTLSSPRVSKVFLSAVEDFTKGDLEDDSSAENRPTVEYWISVREVDASNNVLQEKLAPIVPVGRDLIVEKLIVDDNNIGKLMFSVDPENSDEDLEVFRNGNQILEGPDYTLLHRAPNAGEMLEDGLRVLVPQGYNIQDSYTVICHPLYRKEGVAPIPFKDPTGFLSYNLDGSIIIERQINSRAVRTDINLLIILRGSGNAHETAVVNSYILAVG